MKKRLPFYVGIDLGTSNSAVSVFDGTTLRMIHNAYHTEITPSYVGFDTHGRSSVGLPAKQHAGNPEYRVYSEFKRLMGTGEQMEQLAAEILCSLRKDITRELGIEPTRAVITVPALFELPQANATRQAALRAGFEEIILLQEPVASALAAAWGESPSEGHWLVYDMGGGTFDASLLTITEGCFQVVAHDGDNFLGGRDMDWAIVEWLSRQIKTTKNVQLSRADPQQVKILQNLKYLAEIAKIELSKIQKTTLTLDSITIEITQDDLKKCCQAVMDRSLSVCQRLLQANRVLPHEISQLVFVGGPTLMAFLREQVSQRLGIPIKPDFHVFDPMTLVAKGAALYAANMGLCAWHEQQKSQSHSAVHSLWLRYPPVSSERQPYVIGRIINPHAVSGPEQIRMVRQDGQWTSSWHSLNQEAGFVIAVELIPHTENSFMIEAQNNKGQTMKVDPDKVTIIQGITFADPPLSRSLGIALANNRVRCYFERGESLPARRTFRHTTVDTILQGSRDSLLQIPIVQGDSTYAHRCQLVGNLKITGEQLSASVPAGTEIEITLELDRGGALSAHAWVPMINQKFSDLAYLLVSAASVESLKNALMRLETRLDGLRSKAFLHRLSHLLETLDKLEPLWVTATSEVAAAQGEDMDARLKANRILLELETKLEDCEQFFQWPELIEEEQWKVAWASRWLERYGTQQERRLFAEIGESLQKIKTARSIAEFEQKICLAYELGFSAFLRDPGAWPALFETVAADIDKSSDLPQAYALIQEGRAALNQKNVNLLEQIVRKLWELAPPQAHQQKQAFSSSLR